MRYREILDEINIIGDLPDDANEYRRDHQWSSDIDTAEKVGEIGLCDLLKKSDGIRDIYFFIDNRGFPVGRARVDHDGPSIVTVGHIWLDPKIRGEGYGFRFYEYLLKQNKLIVSDSDHTRQSQGLWKKLAREYAVRPANQLKHEPLTDIMPYYDGHSKKLIASLT